MATRLTSEQGTLDGGAVSSTRFKFAPGEIAQLREIADGQRVECDNCDAVVFDRPDKPDRRVIFNADYFDPWQPLEDTEPEYKRSLCQGCIDAGYDRGGSDFDPEYCERCGRDVIQRCPRNGWRSYFLADPEEPDADCCVGCFQRFILEFGVPRERFEEGRIFCDFYNRDDLITAGFEEHDTVYSLNPGEFCQEMILLIEAGYAVALDQGATGLGNGGPDSIGVWVKRAPLLPGANAGTIQRPNTFETDAEIDAGLASGALVPDEWGIPTLADTCRWCPATRADAGNGQACPVPERDKDKPVNTRTLGHYFDNEVPPMGASSWAE